jgi:MYXO-CTERM domain-containing protein
LYVTLVVAPHAVVPPVQAAARATAGAMVTARALARNFQASDLRREGIDLGRDTLVAPVSVGSPALFSDALRCLATSADTPGRVLRPFALSTTLVTGALLVSGAAAASGPPSPAQLSQLALAAKPAVKIAVRAEGWIRVSGATLHAAGLPRKADPAGLQLFADGVEQPIEVHDDDGDRVLGDSETVEFFGVGRDTLWTDTRTYWLVEGVAGARVPYVVHPRGTAAAPHFRFTASSVERSTYYAPLLNGDASNFFGPAIQTAPVVQVVELPQVAEPTTAVLRIALQGATAGNHVVSVSAAGASLGTCALSGREAATCELPLPTVAEGTTSFTLASIGEAPDVSLVAGLSVEYDRAYVADADRLKLTTHPKTRTSVGGFSSPQVRVVDVTDPEAPAELVVGASGAAAPFTASFDVPDGDADRTLWAFADSAVSAPAAVAPSRPSSWADSGAGELLILAHASLVEAIRPLAERRAAEGWSVALVDLQDVYDEFGAGDKSAFAVRDFVRWAFEHWSVAPRDVLLVGDATFDPRNFLGKGDFDLTPTKLVDTAEMETASDDWFVDLDGDDLPELAVGRIPARTAAQVAAVVRKTLAYDGANGLGRGALFVSDVDDAGLDFEGASAASATAISDLAPVTMFRESDASATPAGLLAALDAGPFLVNYFGHGSVEVWDGLFSSTDASALANAHPSIYVSMNCLNGFFHDLYTTSLAEALLEAENGGAVAVWASSTLTAFEPQEALNRTFVSKVARGSLGQAAMQAKRAISDADARRTWMLFGDPTLLGAPSVTPDGGADARDAAAGDGALRPDGGADARDAAASDGAPRPVGPDAAVVDGASSDGAAAADDARHEDGPRVDSPPDGGRPPRGSSGCDCDLGKGPAPGAPAALMLVIAAALRRRRAPAERLTPGRDLHAQPGRLGAGDGGRHLLWRLLVRRM